MFRVGPKVLKGASPHGRPLSAFSALPRLSVFTSTRNSNHQYSTTQTLPMSSKPASAVANPEAAVKVTSATPFLEAMQNRRSLYGVDKNSPISKERVEEIIKHALLHVPSSFNSQPTRIVLLLGQEHIKLWSHITKEALRAVVPAEAFAPTEQKIDMFSGAYGTVLFFLDNPTTVEFQKKFALYAEQFPTWATESGGMHQYAVWTALEAEGLGASLQHYNQLIESQIQSTWNVSSDWKLMSQLVFGGVKAGAGEKSYKGLEGERFFVYGS